MATSELTARLMKKIDGLEADLEEAVRTAYDRGAIEWTKLNYPDLYAKWRSSRED